MSLKGENISIKIAMNTKLFKTIDPGHTYELAHHQDEGYQLIHFIKNVDAPNTDDIPLSQTVQQGTTNEAVISMLIDRMQHLNELYPSRYNEDCMYHLNMAYEALFARTKDRQERGVEGKHVA